MIDYQKPIWRWLGAAVTGVLLNFVQGVNPWWPVTWFAPIPLLVAALSTSSLHETFRLALVASLLGLISTAWYVLQGGDPLLERAAVAAVFTLPQGLPLIAIVMMWRIAVRDARRWYATLIFPVVAAAVDLVFNSVSWHGTWGSWANSQMGALPLIQMAAVGGTPAMVFVITLPAATVAIALARRGPTATPQLAYGVPVVLVVAALGYGFTRLADPNVMPRVPVGLLAADHADMQPADPGGPGDSTVASYLQVAATLAAKGARFIVLPEKIEILDETSAKRMRGRLSAWAREHRTYLLAGFAIVFRLSRQSRVAFRPDW